MFKSILKYNWNKFLHAIIDTLFLVGDIIILLTYTIIIAFGIPLVLGLTVIVEQQRVAHGIALFEVSIEVAQLSSWVLVILNLVLEGQAHHVEHKSGYKAPEAKERSLRILWSDLGYFLGIGQIFGWGKEWQARMQSPAQKYYRAGQVVTLSILALALAGSMSAEIAKVSGPWHSGIINLVTNSTLSDMTTWVGGLLFAFAAVISAQASSRYVAARFLEIRQQMRYRKSSSRQVSGDVVSDVNLSTVTTDTAKTDNVTKAIPSGSGWTRLSDGQQIVISFLESNPEIVNLSSRKIADLILTQTNQKVSHETVNRARNVWRKERQSEAIDELDTGNEWVVVMEEQNHDD